MKVIKKIKKERYNAQVNPTHQTEKNLGGKCDFKSNSGLEQPQPQVSCFNCH